jgi:hypothetical protein
LSFLRPVGTFILCTIVCLLLLDIVLFWPRFPASYEDPQVGGAALLVNVFAAPVIVLGGLIGGFTLLSGRRGTGVTRRLDWMSGWGAVIGAAYCAIAALVLGASDFWPVLIITGAAAGALSGAIWCLLVERAAGA